MENFRVSALLNLALNASQAMPSGGQLVLSVETAEIDPFDPLVETKEISPGRYIKISVSDTGPGMTPDTLSKAFDPFFTTKSVGEGSGLGLSMVFGFAHQSGGTAQISSKIGVDTTVTLYLSAAQTRLRKMAEATTHIPSVNPSSLSPIMLVENDIAVQNAIKLQLLRMGFQVVSAETGDAAIEMVQAGFKPSVLLSDLVVPGRFRGQALAREVKKLYPGIPVILMTGYPKKQASTDFDPRQDTTILQKPISGDGLHAAIWEKLARSHASRRLTDA